MPDIFVFLGRRVEKMRFISFLGAFLLLTARPLIAQESNSPPAISATLITNLAQFWALPPTEKNRLHRIQLELLIYYCNPEWTVFWGRSGDLDSFLPLRDLPQTLHSGDLVRFDGLILPVDQKFIWDKTSVTVISTSNPVPCVLVEGKALEDTNLAARFIETRALVDSQVTTIPQVLRLRLLEGDLSISAFLTMNDPGQVQPDLSGKYVRIKGVYMLSSDSSEKGADLVLWSPGLNCVEVCGSLATDSQFSRPIVSSENFRTADPHTCVRVAGVVRNQQPGQAVTIWDDAGQIRILSKQQYPLEFGDRIEAIGYPAFQGIDRVLERALFRPSTGEAADSDTGLPGRTQLRLADQIRRLDQESISNQVSVSLEGVVTRVDFRSHFIFILDSSGGIRVMQSRFPDGRPVRTGMMVKVDGVVTMGEFAPAITNAIIRQTGTTSLPDAPLISLEEAMTGTEDGRWIQMRGYVRKSEAETDSIRLELVAPGGEFAAQIPKINSLSHLDGSVVLVRGVCVATANSRRQLTGFQIWSPEVGDVQTEQSAPTDLFARPLRSLASLRQFNVFNALNERVRTRGTVTLQAPGSYLYVQDGDNSVLALSDQTNRLRLGDQVEVVGFPGNENRNLLLREAVYRRVGPGSEPVPFQLPIQQSFDEDLDGRLVCAEGVLFDTSEKPEETRLTIQNKGVIFEAKLDRPGKIAARELALGAKLALTGVYRLQRDEYGTPRSFLLNLRDGNDIRVLQPPPWWTLAKLLWALLGTFSVLVVALLWALGIRRKNNQLLQAQTELKAAHDQLEERVQERTRDLRETNEALRRSEERFVKAFRASPVPLLLQSVGEERCVDVNESFLQLTGCQREEVLGESLAGLKLFSRPETGREILNALSTIQPVRNLQTELNTRDGKTLTVLISAEAFELERQPHFLMTIQDITERLSIESQLRQAQKMEVIGQIAAGVAHDFNNILTVIQGHAEVQLSLGALDESLAESLREISSAATRAASLTRQLLAFSRKQMLQRRSLDVTEALNNLGKMLPRIIGEHINLRIQCAENLPPVFADAINFEQIVINLAVNARDAMPRGGPLTITTGLVVIDAKYREREPDAMVGTFVQLSVADKGSGMDETVRSKIFEPFFTTKGVGKGTGMGLATVYGIVKQHQGWIEVESQPGAGSVFKVFLPIADQEPQKTIEPQTGLMRTADVQTRTIFLVEDETSLREMASKILKRLGYQVVTAGNGPEALALWSQHRGKIDLLLTDMVMPGGMTGRELADCLLREAPGMPVIYSTGYSMDLIDSDTNFGTQVECLFKPYDASALANAVNKVFANGD